MFGKQKQEMMVYVIMGFLEAGKTSLIRDLLVDELFDDKSKTLILVCEEGEEEYPQALLDQTHAACEYIEDEESFNGKVIEKFLKKHRPDRIIIEYNGMWSTKHIPEMYDFLEDICFDREVYFQTIDVVNDETFLLYTRNMPSMMVALQGIGDGHRQPLHRRKYQQKCHSRQRKSSKSDSADCL